MNYPVKINFTPMEREALLHYMGMHCIAETLSDSEEKSEAEITRDFQRFSEIEDRLSNALVDSLRLTIGNADEAEVLIDAFEGNTWWANFCDEGVSRRGVMTRVHNSLKTKLSVTFKRNIAEVLEFS